MVLFSPRNEEGRHKVKSIQFILFPVKIHPSEHQMSKFLFACIVAESAQWYCIQADVERPIS